MQIVGVVRRLLSPGRNGMLMASTVAILLCLTALSAVVAAETPAQRFDLRVYGPISSEVQPVPANSAYRILRFTTQDHAKAELLLSKLIADFTTLPTVRARDVKAGNVNLVALSFESGRCILPVTRGRDAFVDLYTFTTVQDFETFLTTAHPELTGAVKLQTRRHPFFLDRWDRHAMGFWYVPFNGPWYRTDLSNDADFAFFRALDLSVNSNGNIYSTVARCDMNDLGFKTNRWFDVSNYAYDACPEGATHGDPDMTAIYDYYGEIPFAENPIERMSMAELLSNLGQFTANEHFESITSPRGETGPSTASMQGFRERDEYSRQDFIHYLRDLRKISLADLGMRWYGDATRYKAWDEIQFPREREFYGWKDGISQSLMGEWRMRYLDHAAGDAAGVYQPGHDDSSWFVFQTGAQPLSGARKGGWLRRAFTLDATITNALVDKKPVYLTVCPFNSAPYRDPSRAYLNGKKLGEMSIGYGNEWAQYEVSSVLKAGTTNLLTLYTTTASVRGPVFLTLNKYEPFPTSDLGLNARLYDLREWTVDCVARGNHRYLEYLRGIDPARPIKIMAFDSMIDVMMPYAQLEGAYPHCTGESAFYRPWFKRYGYLRGVPDSSEPSQPCANVYQLSGLFFCMTMEGMNAHDYFIHLHNITSDPVQKAWYQSHVAYFKLMGRFDLRKPEIVLARSVKVDRVSPQGEDTAYMNDPGRGDIQEAHHGYVFCSERDLRDGLVDNYKVIVDCNFHTLEPEDLAALTRWVENGGTLVLNQRSGRDTYLKARAWPIASLTGCDYTIRPQTGKVKFVKNPPILKAYAGKSFANKENLYDWQQRHYFTDCVALTPRAKDVTVIARYDDGAAAIVSRPVGKGKVVVLGSAFYRDSHDYQGYFVPNPTQTRFYKELFKDLGVAPLFESNQDKLWGERFIANNGSTEMLILGNKNTENTLENASATWNLDFAPKRVFDPVTGLTMPVRIDGNRVIINNLTLAPFEMRYYAVERTNIDAADALNHWLFRQSQLWHAVPEGRPAPKLDPSWPLYANGEFQVKQFDNEAEARAAMALDFKPDASWKSMLRADWASAGMRTGKDLWAVYRKTIDIDPAWLNGVQDAEFVFSPFTRFDSNIRLLAINGLPIVEDTVAVNRDKLLAALKPGANQLTVLCAARNDGNGGFVPDFCIRRIPAGERQDISKAWDVYPSELEKLTVDFPWSGTRVLARKQVDIPEKYRNHEVWIQADGAAGKDGPPCFVSVNGRWRYTANNYGAKFTNLPSMLVNITPDIRFGEKNEIWLGGSNWHDGIRPTPGNFQSVTLIFRPKNATTGGEKASN